MSTWVISMIFYHFWLQVRAIGIRQAEDYTIEVDIGAVFNPRHLRTWLSTCREFGHGGLTTGIASMSRWASSVTLRSFLTLPCKG